MIKTVLISLLIILFSPNILMAEVEIKATYQDDSYSYALVKYTNTTGKTFELISVICTVSTTNMNFYNTSRSFSYLEYGLIIPGFTETFILEFFLFGEPLKKITCNCINWREFKCMKKNTVQ